ncbi:MAG: redox-regulated ATPase YchF [Candidatus Zixiibacteriota bacterium]
MKIGIVGLPFVGKTTVFNALTNAKARVGEFSLGSKEANKGIVKVPDERVYRLASLYNPKKVTPAEVEYIDVAGLVKETKEKGSEGEFYHSLREVDELAHVVRVFADQNVPHMSDSVDPQRDAKSLDLDLILIDLDIAEKRLRRLEKSVTSSKSEEEKRELHVLQRFKGSLEQGIPLRELELSPDEEKLVRGYAFLSLKPMLVILNVDEEQNSQRERLESEYLALGQRKKTAVCTLCGKLEMELSQLEDRDQKAFMEDLGLEKLAIERVIDASHRLLNLISFFTANENEVRAWSIPAGTKAIKAAGTVHSDMERGFIKAEVITFRKLSELGSIHKAKEKGELRLEGKDYVVQDGDVIFFRFNV